MNKNRQHPPFTVKLRACCMLCCILIFILCACETTTSAPLHTGETYLEGSWYYSEGNLHVGYNFFPDGGGQQFIGGTTIPMRYGIFEDRLHLLIDGELSSISFAQTEEGLLIGGLLFTQIDTDQLPDNFALFQEELSAMQESKDVENAKARMSNPVFWGLCATAISLAVMLALLVIRLIRFVGQRKK